MEFYINGSKWGIQFVTGHNNVLRRSDGSITVGVTDMNTHCIYLSDSLHGAFLERVLCHELCHCVCMVYDISLPLETEERLCNFMSDHGKEIIYLLDDLLSLILSKTA